MDEEIRSKKVTEIVNSLMDRYDEIDRITMVYLVDDVIKEWEKK